VSYKNIEKKRAYQLKWLKERRDKWLEENGPCKKCGSEENLHVHHKDPKTKVSHKVWSWAEERRLKELAKCEVLCCSCHGWTRRKGASAPTKGDI
jgi:5-methylcytosine-specific restriction endonuclease McrA